MSGTAGCPECGAEVKFQTPGAVLCICAHCRSVVAKRGLDYASLGKVAQIAETSSPLAIGMRGGAYGGFEIVGRVQQDHGAGTWNEWYLATDGGQWLWLAEAQGRYYVLAPVGAVANAPPFDRMRAGHTVHVPLPGGKGEAVMRATEVQTAKLVSAEGQLPYEFKPGDPMRYVDLSGAKNSVGTLDYGAPGESDVEGYYGRLVRLNELKLDAASFSAPPKQAKAGKRLSCPKCDGALELRAPDACERVTCPYCRALIDCTKEPLSALATLKKLSPDLEPRFALGSQGTLRGRKFTVLGHMQREITTGEGGHWDEYLLWTEAADSDSAFYYLIESGGHFSLAEPVAFGEVGGSGRHRYYRGHFCSLAETCTTRVVHINGEFSWAVQIGETVEVQDYAASGVMISIETTRAGTQEVNASLAYYLDSDEVWKGFGLTGQPPPKPWVAPHQPNPYRAKWERQKGTLMWATIGMIGLLSFSCARSGQSKQSWVVKTVPGVEPAGEHILISDPFELAKPGAQVAVEVGLNATVDNSWIAADVSLINEDTGEAFTVGLEASYYFGYEDGESWSEGSRHVTSVIPSVPGGKYVARIEPSWPVTQSCMTAGDCGSFLEWSCVAGKCIRPCGETPTRTLTMTTTGSASTDPLAAAAETVRKQYTIPGTKLGACKTGRTCVNGNCVLPVASMVISTSHPTTRYGYAFWLWLIMACVPVWNWLRSSRFEQRRTEDNS